MLSLAADLAWRCVKLNPYQKENAFKLTQGIVLIDEVDLHLHPSWQQIIIKSLLNTFPKIQFIVTTHSPQVLTTVDSSCIRILDSTFDSDRNRLISVVDTPTWQSKGDSSENILARIQRVSPIPNLEESEWVKEYKSKIQQGDLDSESSKELFLNQ